MYRLFSIAIQLYFYEFLFFLSFWFANVKKKFNIFLNKKYFEK